MANKDIARVVLQMEADVRKLRSDFNKANGIVDGSMTKMERSSARASKRMQSNLAAAALKAQKAFSGAAISFGVGLAGGIAAALGPLVLFQKAIRDIGDLNDLKRLSDRVGLTTTTVQALQYGAVQAGVALDQMGGGIGDFASKVAEAASGAGQLAPIFKANNVQLKEADGTLRSTRDVLGDFANLIMNARTPQEQLFLAQQAFGDEAAKLVPIFKNGADGLTKLELNAKSAGAVVDEQLVKRAAELDTRFDTMWQVFSARSKSALLTAIEGMDALLDKMNEYEKGRNAARLGALAGSLVPPKGGTITAPTQDRVTNLDARMSGEPVQADAKLVELLRARFGPGNGPATIIPPSGGSGGGGASKSLKESVDYAQKLIENLEREKSLIGASELEIQKSNALWLAGKDATADQRGEIEALVTSIYTAKMAEEAHKRALEETRDAARDFAGTLVNGLVEGKSAADVLTDALRQLGSRLLNSGLDRLFGIGSPVGGGAGGLLGGAIIPGILHSGGVAGSDGYSHGRSVSPAMFAGAPRMHSGGIAGLKAGEVPAILQRGELVIPRDKLSMLQMPDVRPRSGGGGGGGAPQAVNINVNVSGARGNQEIQQMVASGVSQGIDQFSRSGLPVRIKQINADPRQRG